MNKIPKEIRDYYSLSMEHERLSSVAGQLERTRTEQILDRFLPKPPAVILDVGGGTGAYAFPLAKRGYEVHLYDPIPSHIEYARQVAKSQPKFPLSGISVGDARMIKMEDCSADVVLFLGPLYHLTEKEDRLKALYEAFRTLKVGGLLFAVGISRYTSLIYGLRFGFIDDPEFLKIVKQDLENGQHRNPTGKLCYFTTSFFHEPEELRAELELVGFKVQSLLAIEGPLWISTSLHQYWENPTLRKQLLSFLERIETDIAILGASAHIMAIGKKLRQTKKL